VLDYTGLEEGIHSLDFEFIANKPTVDLLVKVHQWGEPVPVGPPGIGGLEITVPMGTKC